MNDLEFGPVDGERLAVLEGMTVGVSTVASSWTIRSRRTSCLASGIPLLEVALLAVVHRVPGVVVALVSAASAACAYTSAPLSA